MAISIRLKPYWPTLETFFLFVSALVISHWPPRWTLCAPTLLPFSPFCPIHAKPNTQLWLFFMSAFHSVCMSAFSATHRDCSGALCTVCPQLYQNPHVLYALSSGSTVHSACLDLSMAHLCILSFFPSRSFLFTWQLTTGQLWSEKASTPVCHPLSWIPNTRNPSSQCYHYLCDFLFCLCWFWTQYFLSWAPSGRGLQLWINTSKSEPKFRWDSSLSCLLYSCLFR